MNPTITAIIESLLNPQERFRTLKRIAPSTDSSGMPRFSFYTDSAGFEITVDGEHRLLRIPMGWSEQQRIEASHEGVRTASSGGHIARCEYLQNELTTFDARGNTHKSDVILEAMPEGLGLNHFLRTNLDSTGIGNVRGLLASFEDLHCVLYDSSLCHGHIRAENITVTPTGKPVLQNYLHTRQRKPDNDRLSLIYISLLIYITACEPSLHHAIWHTRHKDRHKLTGDILTQAEFSRDGQLADIVCLLGNPASLSAETVKTALHHIAMKPFVPMPLLLSLTGNGDGESVSIDRANDFRASYDAGCNATLAVDFTSCDFVGSLSDTLVRYRKGDKWGFADRHGAKLGEAAYSAAEDFYEGRAAVAIGGRYGLIDRDGAYVMPPVYEALEWYGENNVIAACTDGKWKLYDRCGDALAPGVYDWTGDPCEGIFLVRRGNKYGYISTDGKPLTELRFDEAFSFSDGKALVGSNDQSYHIGTDGKKINA